MMKCCSLFSGSSGNAIFVEGCGTKILIDAGVSGKKIEEGLKNIDVEIGELDAILVSHEHSDHVCSVGCLSKKYDIPVYATELTWNQMQTQSIKINSQNQMVFKPDNWFQVENLDIFPFKIPHDAAEPCGFSILGDTRKVTIATDLGHINSYLLSNMESSDLLLLEANHDVEMLKCGRYPWYLKRRILGDNGHLCNESAAEVITHLVGMGMNRFLLGHLSTENNFPELALQTVANALGEAGISTESIFLEVAPRNRVSSMCEL